jgi:hypothetical protein
MPETIVDLEDVSVLRIQADMQGKSPAAAFKELEARLPTLKGRRFYGTFELKTNGPEYFACVARLETDDPAQMRLEPGLIRGGRFARRKLMDWQTHIPDIPRLFQEMAAAVPADRSRPSVEYYRSSSEVHLLLPVLDTPK